MRKRLRAVLRRLTPRVKRRAIADAGGQLAGAAAVGYGLWQVYEPLAWIVCGAGVLVVSFATFGGEKP